MLLLCCIGEVREGADRVGFEVVTLDGRRGLLASTKISRFVLLFIFLLFDFLPFPAFSCGWDLSEQDLCLLLMMCWSLECFGEWW